jgi:arylsulfatase A-like enzyme/Flp pilus assembly protein TadD
MRDDLLQSPFFRLWLMRLALGGFCLALLLGEACRRSEAPATSKPSPRDANILLITLDTTRADHLSCYSDLTAAASHPYHGPKTPHLDALAARGIRFTHATVQAPLTLPSHASIMTGEDPPQHGLRNMEGFILAGSHPTLASIAQSNGYATAAFVGSRVLASSFGLARGFATYDDDMGKQNYLEPQLDKFAERRAAVVTERALEWLKGNGRKRFFLWAHYYDPHAPYDPPEPYKHLYARDLYSGEIAYMDNEVGRLLVGLKELGLESRTLVAVIGDHGESLGEHGEMTHGVFLYESTLHVPFIIAGPEVPGGKVIDDQVRSIDVMPTLLAFLNLPPGPEAQGVSLWPLILQGIHVRSDYSYSETIYPRYYMGWSELRAMRTDTWKLIVAPHPELYNLQHDPGEVNNLISKFPADADQLQKKIWEVAGTQGREEKIVSSPVDSQTRQELESLGYVSAGTPRQIQLGTSAPDPKDRINILKMQVQAEKYQTDKDPVHAAQVMEQALRLDPTNPRCHLYLGRAYEDLGQYPRAIQVYQHALAMKLESDKIYSRLGIDYLHLQDFPKAVDALNQAKEINPLDLDNLLNLGMAYLQQGRRDDAERAFKAITAQNDRFAPAYDGLGLLAVERKDTETARREFEKALEVNPQEVRALLDLGILYQQTGNREQALHYLQAFLDKAPRGEFSDQIPEVRDAIQDLKAHKE